MVIHVLVIVMLSTQWTLHCSTNSSINKALNHESIVTVRPINKVLNHESIVTVRPINKVLNHESIVTVRPILSR